MDGNSNGNSLKPKTSTEFTHSMSLFLMLSLSQANTQSTPRTEQLIREQTTTSPLVYWLVSVRVAGVQLILGILIPINQDVMVLWWVPLTQPQHGLESTWPVTNLLCISGHNQQRSTESSLLLKRKQWDGFVGHNPVATTIPTPIVKIWWNRTVTCSSTDKSGMPPEHQTTTTMDGGNMVTTQLLNTPFPQPSLRWQSLGMMANQETSGSTTCTRIIIISSCGEMLLPVETGTVQVKLLIFWRFGETDSLRNDKWMMVDGLIQFKSIKSLFIKIISSVVPLQLLQLHFFDFSGNEDLV